MQASCGERKSVEAGFIFPLNNVVSRSTRNTRIERLWVEVGAQFARRWRAFFQRLEDIHGLDIHNQTHLWLLHELFLDEINKDCEQFCSDWNSHPVSGVGHDQSPEVINIFLDITLLTLL